MNPQRRAQEIIAAFQRYLSSNDRSEINEFTLSELRSADEQWGQRDVGAGFRIALQNRIKEIEEENQQKRESNIRTVGYIVAFAIAVLAGVVLFYITKQT